MATTAKNKVTLNKWQETFIHSSKRYLALFNEFGSGKTTAGILRFAKMMQENPNNYGVVVRNLHDDLRNATIPQFFDLLFGSRFEVPENIYWNSTNKFMRLPNGSEIQFLALDRPDTYRKLKNLVVGCFFIDQGEEIAEEVWTILEGRMRLTGVQHSGFMTGNPEGGDHWIKDKFYAKPINVTKYKIDDIETEYGYWQGITSDYVGIVAKPLSNALNLPAGYYERLKQSFPRDWLLKYVYSLWTGKVGMIYPFSDKNIIYEPYPFDLDSLPKYSVVGYAQDYGISDTSAMVWLTVVKHDEMYYVIDEYYQFEQGIDAVCDYVKLNNDKMNIPARWTIGCPATFQKEASESKRQVNRMPVELFRAQGIDIGKYPVSFESRQPILAKLIEDGKFKVFARCENLIKELKGFKWKNFKTANNHAIEAVERAIHKFENVTELDVKDLYNLPAGL